MESLSPLSEVEQLRAELERASIRAARLADDLDRMTAERDELLSRIAHNAPALIDDRGTTWCGW